MDLDATLDRFVTSLKLAAVTGEFQGKPTGYLQLCKQSVVFNGVGILAIFTRDTGYHTSGWWKNPDYERCFHLSLSFVDAASLERMKKQSVLTEKILDRIYGRNKKLLWCEPPYSAQGKADDVWHYRLFCNPAWEPIQPRGEVYGHDLTAAGWKSYSDLVAAAGQIDDGKSVLLEASQLSFARRNLLRRRKKLNGK